MYYKAECNHPITVLNILGANLMTSQAVLRMPAVSYVEYKPKMQFLSHNLNKIMQKIVT